jgi:hypothetical protein
MPRRARPTAKLDANQIAAALVQAVTDSEPANGEELLGSEELRRQLREAKEADKARHPRKLAKR